MITRTKLYLRTMKGYLYGGVFSAIVLSFVFNISFGPIKQKYIDYHGWDTGVPEVAWGYGAY